MKAIRVAELGGPDVLRLVEVETIAPGEGEVAVEVRAAGVNPVETYVRAGAYGKAATLPYTPGSDGAGIVCAVGSGVNGVQPGERVFLTGSRTGTYAEQAICARDDVHPLPAAVSFAQGAALGVPYATAWRALFQRGGVEAGETILVHGASGGVGTAAVQLAAAAGVRVLATAGSAAGRDLVRSLGAAEVFDHFQDGYREAILATAGGVDCILEMLANVNLGEDLRLLAPRGRVVVIGSRGPVEINPREAMGREADIRGLMLSLATPAERAVIHRALEAGLAEGTIRPVIDREFPLAEAAAAHAAVMAGNSLGKIVLIP